MFGFYISELVLSRRYLAVPYTAITSKAGIVVSVQDKVSLNCMISPSWQPSVSTGWFFSSDWLLPTSSLSNPHKINDSVSIENSYVFPV